MKKLLTSIVIMLFVWSCSAPKTTMSGLDNVSFIEIYGDTKVYNNAVELYVDNNPVIIAEINKAGKSTMKPKSYQVSTGKHTVKIVSQGKEVFNSPVFLSSQITKKINLP